MYGNQYQSTPPVREGEELDVKVEAVGEKGDGIAKKDGFVIFVPGTKAGDEVRIRVTRVLSKVGFAEKIGDAEKKAAPAKPAEPEFDPKPELDSEDFGDEDAGEAPDEAEDDDAADQDADESADADDADDDSEKQ